MFEYERNSISMNEIADKIKESYSNKNYKNSFKITNNPFKINLEDCCSSRFNRSWDSMMGTYMQHYSVKVALNQNWEIINDGDNHNDIIIKGNFSDETRKIIDEFIDVIEKSNKKNPLSKDKFQDYMIKIKDNVLSTCGKETELHADLVIRKDNIIYGIEEKAGGDLDKGKSKNQKKELLTLYALLVSKYKKEILKGDIDIEIKLATFYNKDNIDKGKTDWTQASVKKYFLEDELLIGKDFWAFLTDDQDAYSKILNLINNFKNEFEECKNIFYVKTIEDILDNIHKIENINIRANILNMIKEDYLINEEHLRKLIKENNFNILTLSNNKINIQYKNNSQKTFKFLSNLEYLFVLKLLKNEIKLKEIKEGCFIFS